MQMPRNHQARVWCGASRALVDVRLTAAKLLGIQLHNPKSQKPIRRWQDRPFSATISQVTTSSVSLAGVEERADCGADDG